MDYLDCLGSQTPGVMGTGVDGRGRKSKLIFTRRRAVETSGSLVISKNLQGQGVQFDVAPTPLLFLRILVPSAPKSPHPCT